MKKILTLFTTVALIFSSAITCFASGSLQTTDLAKDIRLAFTCFTRSSSAITAAVVFCVVVLLILIFRKKLQKLLYNSSASSMINAFILFFSAFGIATLAMAFASDGETWSNLMHHTTNSLHPSQFEDYIKNLQFAGSQHFYLAAETNTPFALLIFFILAQFMPTNYIFSESAEEYGLILKNQTFMFLYLILATFIVVLMYRMNRYVLRSNSLNIRDEVVSFLLVVSYPAVYCIEKGNFMAISLVLSMIFIIFCQSEKSLFRELSLVTLAVSAAITPCTLIFAFLLLDRINKKSIIKFARTILYFVILFITPAIFTGFGNLLTYVKAFVSVDANGYITGNMSIVNLLTFFGITNAFAVYTIFAITEILALVAMIKLPSIWQKTAAAAYIMLNIFSVSEATIAIFIFIPLVFLLAEKKHTAINWVYLGTIALIVTPFPEWFRSDIHKFSFFLTALNINTIYNANNLISLAAVQFMFLILVCQSLSLIIKNSKNGKIKQQTVETVA